MDLFDDRTIMEGRQDALFAMTSECLIKRPTGLTYDPELGHEVATYEVVYTGRCALRVEAAQPADLIMAGAEYQISNMLAKLPIFSGAAKGDLIEITSSRFDLPRPGTKAELLELSAGTHRTAERWRAIST